MAVVTVQVSQAAPVLTITSTGLQVCPGQSLSLQATGAVTYTWSGGISNGQLFAPASSTSYVVSGQNGCGTTTAGVNVTVSPLPISIASTASAVCIGSTAIITTTTTGNTYSWSPGGQTTSSIIVSPNVNTIYTVAATDGTCSGTNTISIGTILTPTLLATTSSSNICQGNTATLSVSGADNYTWNPGAMTGSMITVAPSTSSLYTVIGQNNLGCSASAQQIVLVQSAPSIVASTNASLVCAFGTSTLFATTGSNLSYTWSVGGNNSSAIVSPSVSSIYTIICGHTTNTCVTEATVGVTVLQTSVTLPSNTVTCKGKPIILTSTGADEYIWNGFPMGTNGSYTVSGTNSETVVLVANTISNNVVCPTNHSVTITVNPNPTVTAVSTRSTICRGESNTVTANGASTYSWSNGNTGSVSVLSPTTLTNYTIQGTDNNGCEGKTTINLFVNACTGVNEITYATSIQVYPNPNHGKFTLVAEGIDVVSLFNLTGQLIHTYQLNKSEKTNLEISGLSPGLYFIRYDDYKTSRVVKIIVSE